MKDLRWGKRKWMSMDRRCTKKDRELDIGWEGRMGSMKGRSWQDMGRDFASRRRPTSVSYGGAPSFLTTPRLRQTPKRPPGVMLAPR
jgi:hypothetical protein